MRAFIALPLADATRRSLAEIQRTLLDSLPPCSIRLEKQENFHVTLRFLGEIDEKRTEPLGKIIEKAAEGIESARGNIERLGVFQGNRNARVFWAGLNFNEDPIYS